MKTMIFSLITALVAVVFDGWQGVLLPWMRRLAGPALGSAMLPALSGAVFVTAGLRLLLNGGKGRITGWIWALALYFFLWQASPVFERHLLFTLYLLAGFVAGLESRRWPVWFLAIWGILVPLSGQALHLLVGGGFFWMDAWRHGLVMVSGTLAVQGSSRT